MCVKSLIFSYTRKQVIFSYIQNHKTYPFIITTLTTSGLQQEIISEFYSQDDLLDALVASIFCCT